MADDTRVTDVARWHAVQELANEMRRDYADWRHGQALFNALHSIEPDLANAIRGSQSDPFYRDARIEAFGQAVMAGVVR